MTDTFNQTAHNGQDGVHAPPLRLHQRMSAEQALRRIAANCCEQIAANQPAVARANTPEALHQMRVGLRRLGSLLRLYRPVLTLPNTLQQELDWLQDKLGPARDWNVLAMATLPRIAKRLPDNLELLRSWLPKAAPTRCA